MAGSASAAGETASDRNSLGLVTDFVLNLKPEAIPAPVMQRAALLLLDTLGVAIGATPMEAGTIARETAVALFGSQHPVHSARMMFDGRRVSIAGAAFATATGIDNLDAHDGYNPTKGHIGVVVLPTLAALAESLPGLSGPEALAAYVVGYEVSGRAATALHATVPEYHTSGAWNALGVAAMVCRMRGMTPAQFREAVGIAEFHGPRSQMMREIATPTMLHDGSAWGAMAGVTAAVQAGMGFTGAPAITIEAPEVVSHWADLGQVWQVPLQYIKPYPICRWAHAAIDGTRKLVLENDLRPGDIAQITIRSFRYATELWGSMPGSTSRAQYGLPFPVAVMVAYRRIGVEHISGEGLRDPLVADILGRIVVEESPRHTDRYPAGRWADVTIRLKDGTTLETGDIHARGGPDQPFGQDEIVEKFLQFASPVVGEARARDICARVLGLTAADSRFAALAELLYDIPGQGS